MFRPVLRTAIVSVALISGCAAVHAENRLALVIGQSAYRAVTPLSNPANDAKAMAQLLGDAGFEVLAAPDLTQDGLRQKLSEFAGQMAAKGPDTVALVFYAGHGMQIDGENYLIPVDLDPKREADVPLQAVRLNDLLNTLNAVPSKARIVLLDACRNNPFPNLNKTAGHGLAIVDARFGAAGTFISFSTSPGAESEDGDGADSPYTTALLKAAKEPGLPIEEAFKRVRIAVNTATSGRQTPWDSSSLTSDFRFFGQPADAATAKPAAAKRSVDEWRMELLGKEPEVANTMVVSDGTVEAYEAFVALFPQPPFGPSAKIWLDRQHRMQAWNNAVLSNTGVAYRSFLQAYPDSDLTSTARKLEERTRNRPVDAVALTAPVIAPVATTAPGNVALTCPCTAPTTAPALQKVDLPAKQVDPNPPKRGVAKPPRRGRGSDDDVMVVHRPPPVYYDEPPVGVGIGIGIGGFRGGGMNGGRGRY